MTPVKITGRFLNARTGRPETQAATSECGLWDYVRTEEPGTPWMITGQNGRWTLATSLAKARRLTCLPDVDSYLTDPA